MSSTASRTYAVNHVEFAVGNWPVMFVGTESASEALRTSGDGKYVLLFPKVGQVLWTKPAYDGAIPTGAVITSIDLSMRLASGEPGPSGTGDVAIESFATLIGSKKVANPDPTDNYFLPTQSVVVFANTFPYTDLMSIGGSYWQNASASFVNIDAVPDPEVFQATLIPSYYLGVKLNGATATAVVATDYVRITFNFTLFTGIPATPTVYDTTPYGAKVSAAVTGVSSYINSTYPLTSWFEWTSVDPTIIGATDTVRTTPVQTFTEGNPTVYDTLPSPLNVQNPAFALRSNTTYWVRSAAKVNGETAYSAWASFTTPLRDRVLL